MRPARRRISWIAAAAALAARVAMAGHDAILRGGTICDGSGGAPYSADLAIDGDKIARIGDLSAERAPLEIDARGLAVAPGFINMLSWSTESLLEDGRSQGELRQGVTLEVMGEGVSMGPMTEKMKADELAHEGDIKYKIDWTTLGEYLEGLERRGVSCNVASFVGATTLRIHEIGYEDRAPTPEELARMKALAARAMDEGAMGVASALIYAPAFYAKTDELAALAAEAARGGGMYITHMRSEGSKLLEAIDETLEIGRRANCPVEIYHMKAAGQANWGKLDAAIAKIEAARAAGMRVTADMYLYEAAGTGLDAAMPPWVQEGGHDEWAKRLKDPAIRERVRREMDAPSDAWENFYWAAGGPDRIILSSFKNEALKPLAGKTLAEAAAMRGKSPEETAMDLVVEDGSRVGAIYFLMSEENVLKEVKLPWVSFCSDAASMAPEGVFLKSSPHPRAYGNFARLLGKYVRERKAISLAEAARRLAALPAQNLRLDRRGELKPGFFADLAIFDPATIADRATYDRPHQYAVGMVHVFVNGVQVLREGEHTGAKPGRFLRGPGWKGARK